MNVPSLQPQNESQPDEQTLSQYAEHTRKSLIARLENWEDQRTWDEFYRTYWRLIYSVALKAGLREDEAWDVVQETILSIAKQSKKNIYKPEQGSFKLWLWNMTRWRINDQFRKRKKDTAMLMSPDAKGRIILTRCGRGSGRITCSRLPWNASKRRCLPSSFKFLIITCCGSGMRRRSADSSASRLPRFIWRSTA